MGNWGTFSRSQMGITDMARFSGAGPNEAADLLVPDELRGRHGGRRRIALVVLEVELDFTSEKPSLGVEYPPPAPLWPSSRVSRENLLLR